MDHSSLRALVPLCEDFFEIFAAKKLVFGEKGRCVIIVDIQMYGRLRVEFQLI